MGVHRAFGAGRIACRAQGFQAEICLGRSDWHGGVHGVPISHQDPRCIDPFAAAKIGCPENSECDPSSPVLALLQGSTAHLTPMEKELDYLLGRLCVEMGFCS